MRIIIFGVPGSGKGTQSYYISQKFNIPKIDTGQILRTEIQSRTKLGEQVKKTIENGKLVSDTIIISLTTKRLAKSDCINGFVLDGFPRTLNQAHYLEEAGIVIDHVIEIIINYEEIISRITGRLIHPASERIYHLKYNPPKKENTDDITGDPLITREDDKKDIIRERLMTYNNRTKPLINFYKNIFNITGYPKYHSISGIGSINTITNKIYSVLY